MTDTLVVGYPTEFTISPCNEYHYKTVDLSPIEVDLNQAEGASTSSKRKVLVIKTGDKFHAVDAFCPHQGYPLSKGKLVDIEDFGICFGKAIKCPAHFWTFSLDTGDCDRSPHKLKRYECSMNSAGQVIISIIPMKT